MRGGLSHPFGQNGSDLLPLPKSRPYPDLSVFFFPISPHF